MKEKELINLLEKITVILRKESDHDDNFNFVFSETAQLLKADRALLFLFKYYQSIYQNQIKINYLNATINLVNEWVIDQGLTKSSLISVEVTDCLFCQKFFKNPTDCLIINNLEEEFNQEEIKKIEVVFQPKTYPGMIIIPLIHYSNSPENSFVILGVLMLQYQQICFLTPQEKVIGNWLGLQISNKIIQSQALRQVQNIVDERTSQLKWSLEVQHKLSEKMRHQIEQLKYLNQLKDDFMSSMSHELNTPLTTMKMAIKMLRQTGELSDRQIRYLDILEQEWQREFNLIKDLLTLQKIESHEFIFNFKELEIEPILKQAFQIFQEKWLAKGLELEWNINAIRSPLKVYTDEESFTHILNELLLNAGKYSDPETLVIFNIDQEIKSGKENIILEISNCGVEISPEEMPHIFDKFRRGQGLTDQAVPGTGLGLTLVKMLVEQLNGKIEVNSEKDENFNYFINTFTVILPHFKV